MQLRVNCLQLWLMSSDGLKAGGEFLLLLEEAGREVTAFPTTDEQGGVLDQIGGKIAIGGDYGRGSQPLGSNA